MADARAVLSVTLDDLGEYSAFLHMVTGTPLEYHLDATDGDGTFFAFNDTVYDALDEEERQRLALDLNRRVRTGGYHGMVPFRKWFYCMNIYAVLNCSLDIARGRDVAFAWVHGRADIRHAGSAAHHYCSFGRRSDCLAGRQECRNCDRT